MVSLLQLPKRKQALQELASETTRLQSLTRSKANFLPVSALQRYALLASTFREDYTVAAVAVDGTPPEYPQDIAHAFVCLMTAAVEVAPASVLDPRSRLISAVMDSISPFLKPSFDNMGALDVTLTFYRRAAAAVQRTRDPAQRAELQRLLRAALRREDFAIKFLHRMTKFNSPEDQALVGHFELSALIAGLVSAL